MQRRATVTALTALTGLVLSIGVTATGAQAADPPQRLTGTLANGAPWIADVPADWNGTLILYSHGYSQDNEAQNAPDPGTAAALLNEGYALAGSGYSRPGWAMATAAADQLGTLTAVASRIGEPRRTIALGTSMGGLVSSQLAEGRGRGKIDAVLTTCGLVHGGVDLLNYQLDGAHAINQLLLPAGQGVRLTDYTSFAEVQQTIGTMAGALAQGQSTPAGRARVALAAALHHLPTWSSGAQPPTDVDAQQAQQYAVFTQTLGFVLPGRFDIEQTVGGNASSNRGVDYAKLFAHSEQKELVTELYRRAGLDLAADLATLTRTADVVANPVALVNLTATSTLTGQLEVPVLALHTVSDVLAPVQVQEEYVKDVRKAGSNAQLRQAYVSRVGHCQFSPAEMVASVHALDHRLDKGNWGSVANPAKLDATAEELGLGESRIEPSYKPAEFLGDRS